jgi:Carboxypeptidase regulatory-like domain
MRCILCAWLLTAILPTLAPCQPVRHLTGKVLLPDGKPAQGAVVKLRDQTKDIRTAITSADGSFQFSRVLSDLDYQVRATLGNMESHHVSWSRLSDRKEKVVILILRPVRKPGKVSVPLTHGRDSVLALACGQVTYL